MEIRAVTDDEIPRFRAELMATFGGDPQSDPEGDARLRTLLDRQRIFGAFDGDTLVATAGSFDLSLVVPGGASVPMAGLTMVTVRATHRRRGVLRGLMGIYLEAAKQQAQPLCGLWASETSIYGRFGFGIAAESDDLAFVGTGLQIAPGRELDEVTLSAAPADDLPPIYDLAMRPGMYARSRDWWRTRKLADRADLAKGATPRRHAVARRRGIATGYLTYRQRAAWTEGLPNGAVEVEELIAVDPTAEATLWRYATTVDLFPRVTWGNAPVDTVLPWIASDTRRLRRRRTDTLWLRPEDIAASLGARAYSADGVLLVACEGETHELRVDNGVGRCTRVDGPADIQLDRAALGSIYLGGVTPSLLARAGRITGDPAAITRADRMFAWPLAPWCAEMF